MSEHPSAADRPTGPGGSGHPEIDELAAYAAGDLDAAGRVLILDHIRSCAACTGDVLALERATARLGELVAAPMPADVAARLDAVLAREASSPGAAGLTSTGAAVAGTVLPTRLRRRTPGWASGAAAAVVVGLLAAVVFGSINRSASKQDTARSNTAAAPTAALGRRYASGTNYTAAGIREQVAAVLAVPTDARVGLGAAAKAGGAATSAAASQEFSAAASSTAAASAGSEAASSSAPEAQAAAPAAPSAASSASATASAAAGLLESSASAAPAPTSAAAADAKSAAALSGDTSAATSAPASAPPADLSALRDDPARLARCIESVTGGLTRPIAIDFASYDGRPALAIVLPTSSPARTEVFLVGGECGAGADATVLHYATLQAG